MGWVQIDLPMSSTAIKQHVFYATCYFAEGGEFCERKVFFLLRFGIKEAHQRLKCVCSDVYIDLQVF